MLTETVRNEQVKAWQMDVVHQLYVGTADQNYITARWCFTNRFYTDFFWLSVHALEKYEKAVLLLNNATSQKFSHDIVALYEAIKPICADLLPRILTAPKGLQTGRDVTPEQFLGYLYQRGNPDNRYLVYGYSTFEQDIFMLDQMVFAVRRVGIPLDNRAFPKHVKCTMTYRERLRREPEYFTDLRMPLDLAIQDKGMSPVRMAAFALNLTAFTPAGFEDVSASLSRIAFQNSAIALRILDPLKRGDPVAVAIALPVARWCLDNIQLPPNLRKEIEEAVTAAQKIPC